MHWPFTRTNPQKNVPLLTLLRNFFHGFHCFVVVGNLNTDPVDWGTFSCYILPSLFGIKLNVFTQDSLMFQYVTDPMPRVTPRRRAHEASFTCVKQEKLTFYSTFYFWIYYCWFWLERWTLGFPDYVNSQVLSRWQNTSKTLWKQIKCADPCVLCTFW